MASRRGIYHTKKIDGIYCYMQQIPPNLTDCIKTPAKILEVSYNSKKEILWLLCSSEYGPHKKITLQGEFKFNTTESIKNFLSETNTTIKNIGELKGKEIIAFWKNPIYLNRFRPDLEGIALST